ncbi:hypothetical protein HDV01_006524 [Terramyces sp. JEL0728]|nr:hypothetical protein HDV01_006524 [Terramyces sp. JEL0728]
MENSGFLLQHCGLLVIFTIIYSTFKLLDSSQVRKRRAPSDLAIVDTVVVNQSSTKLKPIIQKGFQPVKEGKPKDAITAEKSSVKQVGSIRENKSNQQARISPARSEQISAVKGIEGKIKPTAEKVTIPDTASKLSVRERILQLEKERVAISAKKEYLKKIGSAAKPTISIGKVETLVNHTNEPEIIKEVITPVLEKEMPIFEIQDEKSTHSVESLPYPTPLDIQIPDIVLSSPEFKVSFDTKVERREYEERSDIDFSGTNESQSEDEQDLRIEKTTTTISLDSYQPQLKNSLFNAISADLDLSFAEEKKEEYPPPKPEIESEPFTRKLTLSYFRKGIDLSFDDFDHMNSKRDSIDSTLTVSEAATLTLNESSFEKTEIEKSDSFETMVETERPEDRRTSNRDSAISFTPKRDIETKFVDLSLQNLSQLPFKTNLYHNVTHLRLDQNLLTTIPGHSMKHLRYLKILNLAHNLLEFLPSDIGMLTHLENLFLNNNRLVESLVSLDLCYNQLSILPTSIGHLTYLQELNLLGNPFNPLFDPVVSPLNKSMKENYSNYQASIWNNTEAQKQKKKMVHLSQPSQGYLERLQGFLMDIYDLQTQKPSVKQQQQPEFVPPEFILSRILVTSYQQLPKRERVVQEILETEKTYVEQLQIMYDLYYIPMIESKNFPPFIMKMLFGNIDHILKFHQRTILPCIMKLSQTPAQTMGEFFSNISRNLMMYSAFMNNYDHSELIIQTFLGKANSSYLLPWLSISDSLATSFQYHMEHAKANERHSQINLSSYLILPIQRLPRYKLLLSSLIEKTPQDHPDYHSLLEASRDIHNTVEKCNDLKRVFDQQQASLSILGKIKPTAKLTSFYFKDISPSRQLLYYSQSFVVLKYLKKGFEKDQLNPLVLVSNKKPQIRFSQFDIFTEYKFKPSKDQSSSKMARLVEQGGPISRYDVPFILGKKCHFILLSDLIVIANSDWKLCGCFPINVNTRISFMPIHVMNEARESIMRVCSGNGLVYFKGSTSDISTLVSKLNDL